MRVSKYTGLPATPWQHLFVTPNLRVTTVGDAGSQCDNGLLSLAAHTHASYQSILIHNGIALIPAHRVIQVNLPPRFERAADSDSQLWLTVTVTVACGGDSGGVDSVTGGGGGVGGGGPVRHSHRLWLCVADLPAGRRVSVGPL